MYSLTTISSSNKAKNEIRRQLNHLIGNLVKISSFYYDEIKDLPPIEDELILITAPSFADRILPLIKNNNAYIIAKRTINPKNLKDLFNIPPNSDVLVVNDQLATTQELILELENIGMDNIKFIPYDHKLKSTHTYKYAITAGESELVPHHIPHVIDLGHRLISIMTIADILYYFTGSASCDNLVHSRYIRSFVELSMELSKQYEHNKILRKQLETVISNFENGVLVTDVDNIITFHNSMATSILNTNNILGKALDEFLSPVQINSLLNSEFLHVNNNTIHTTKKEIVLSQNNRATLFILEDLCKIQHIDEEYRIHTKHSQNYAKYMFSNILFKSKKMQNLIEKAKYFSNTASTILITGESGTGKELLAQAIHNNSLRKNSPFVAINCAALSESLLESELFGYEEGAFTGAKKGGKRGLFELAHTGSIFLDEIGDAPLSIQTKLLRVLQEKEIMRIAGDKTIPIDVRVIAATNKNLITLVEKGLFRQDLYYRLKVLPLHIPSLRERRDDVEIILNSFILKFSSRNNKKIPQLSEELKVMLRNYDWPGNIRELENVAEYICNVSSVSNNLEDDVLQVLNYIPDRKNVAPINTKNILFPNEEIKKECFHILDILNEAKTKEISLLSRRQIKNLLQKHQILLSEQQVKTRLEILKKLSLIDTFIGKGTSISTNGENYLNKKIKS